MNSPDLIYSINIPSPVGSIAVLFDEEDVLEVILGKSRPSPSPLPQGERVRTANKIKKEFAEYFAGKRKNFTLKFSFNKLGLTNFQIKTLKGLLNIPYSKTISYKKLAKSIGKPRAFRAVGNANGKNPLPIIIPCHRVIAANGGIGGFSCGLDIKRKLLKLEMSEKGGAERFSSTSRRRRAQNNPQRQDPFATSTRETTI